MGLFDRITRVVRANVNDLVSKAEDPEKMLDQAIIDMQEDMMQLRQAVALAIASQKKTEQEYTQNQSTANTWHQRAQLALQKGDEALAREALQRKKSFAETAAVFKQQLDQQSGQMEILKRNLIALEGKISEAKTKKNMLKARAQAAKANEQLQQAMGNINMEGSMAVFERMEEKVMALEARSQAAMELGGTNLESKFAALEAGSDVDDELLAMKAQMLGGSSSTQAKLPAASQSPGVPSAKSNPEVDAELEALRAELGNF